MPYTRPSLQQIIDRILADISAKLGEKASILRRAWTRVWSMAFGGAVHMLYGYIAWAKDQFFIDSADDEAIVAKASFYGLSRYSAEYASGTIKITGTVGAPVPAQTIFVNSSNDRYLTLSAAVLGGSGASVQVRAYLPGLSKNLIGDSLVQLESPLAGVNAQATVDLGDPITGGIDLETIEQLKKRLLARVQNPPQGGSKSDYEAWAREESGLGVVKVYAPGEISTNPFLPEYGYTYVYFSLAGSTVTPSAPKILAVKNKILAKMPVTARVQVFGIEFVPISFNIKATPSDGYTFAQMSSDIISELTDLMEDSALPFETLTLSNINEAISRPASEKTHILVSPVADLTFAYNQMGKLNLPLTIVPI